MYVNIDFQINTVKPKSGYLGNLLTDIAFMDFYGFWICVKM